MRGNYLCACTVSSQPVLSSNSSCRARRKLVDPFLIFLHRETLSEATYEGYGRFGDLLRASGAHSPSAYRHRVDSLCVLCGLASSKKRSMAHAFHAWGRGSLRFGSQRVLLGFHACR